MKHVTLANPSIAIVVLNWNGRDDTVDCIKSLREVDYDNFTIIVVDNASRDGSEEKIRRDFPEIQFLQTGSNLGYAGGNNAGIKLALTLSVDFILLLNNDTVVDKSIISAFVEESKNRNNKFILGAMIFFYDRPNILWHAGGSWCPATLSFKHLGFNCTVEKFAISDEGRLHNCDYVTGCALFVPASIFKEIGLLDEKFFLAYEEVDWCYRARKRGFECAVVPTAILWHKVSASFGGAASPLVSYFNFRNKLLWAEKHCSWRIQFQLIKSAFLNVKLQLIHPIAIADNHQPLPTRLIWTISTWWRGSTQRRRNPQTLALIYGLKDYLLRRFGNCSEKIRNALTRKLNTN